MGAEAIAFDGPPRHLKSRGTLVARSDAVHPVIVRREIPAWPSHLCHVELLRAFEDVAAEAVAVGKRRFLVEDAAVDAAAQVLDEISVDQRVDVADDALGVDLDTGA